MSKRERNAIAVKKYYDAHAGSVIKQKTLRFLAEKGRIPKDATMDKYDIDRDLVTEALGAFVRKHPTSNTAKRLLGVKVEKGNYKCSKCGMLKRGHVCGLKA